MNEGVKEAFLPGAFVLLVLTGGVLLVVDGRMKAEASGARLIGVVSFQQGKSQRRAQNGAVFYALAADQPVFNGDLVRTARGTTATFLLKDGTRVELGELSMAALHLSDQETKVQMDYGNVRSETGGKRQVRLMVGERALLSRDGIVSAGRARGSDEARLMVEKGSGLLEDRGRTVPLAAGRQVSAGPESSRETAIGVLPLEPAPGATLNATDAERTITFRWKGDGKTKLFITRHGSAQAIHNDTHEGDSFALALAPGVYAWSVVGAEVAPGGGVSSRSLFVRSITAPELIEPRAGETVETATNTARVLLRWRPLSFAKGYVSELSGAPDFGAGVTREESASASSMRTLPPGKYYWRIATVSADGSVVPMSSVGSFSIRTIESLTAPVPEYPRTGSVESSAAARRQGVLFSWKSRFAGLTSVEVSESESFKPIVARSAARGSSAQVKIPARAGTYFWRVQTRLADGRLTPYSPASVLLLNEGLNSVRLLRPEKNAVFAARTKVRFAWDGGGSASRFQLVIAADRQFTRTVRSLSTSYRNAALADLPAGDYFWRVASPGSNAAALHARSFSVQDRLLAPSIQEPASDALVDMSARDVLHFRWSRVAGAAKYRLTVRNARGQTLVDTTAASSHYEFRDLGRLDVGRFAVEVVPITAGGTAGAAAKSSFQLSLGSAPGAPSFADTATRYIPEAKKQ